MITPRPTSTGVFGRSEIARLILLGGVAAWLLHPFATNRQIGAGDALWYANMLADFCLQWREGVFPVFVGQTEFAFNGAVYPLRVAPLYQHLGGILDFLTGRQLGWFALQHLGVIVCGTAGIFSSYFSLAALAPNHRWSAAALATLYLSCPGLLGTVYTQDLYMTWMTVPFAPLAVYGALRPFQRDDFATQVWFAAALAALWLAHSPIALWMTLLTGGIQGFRLLTVDRTFAAWRRAGGGALLFALLAHYPFVSVAALHVPGTSSAVTAGLEHGERISNVVREVFPAVLFPLSSGARALSDLQLGYGLWFLALATVVALVLSRSRMLAAVLVACAVLLILLLPVPGNNWLWAHLPEQIKRITFYWPMHRFYLLLAALLAGAGQLACSQWNVAHRRAGQLLQLSLFVACGWSLWESRQFVTAGKERTASAEVSALHQRPENRLLMNHAYGLFSALPVYFSHGTVDPRSEMRLLDPATQTPLPRLAPAPRFESLTGHVDENPGILKLDPMLRLQPGKSYELIFEFLPRTYAGILQLSGQSFFREYALPASGESAAFGSGAGHEHTLVLWTTRPEGEEIALRFIPTALGETPRDYAEFSRFHFGEIADADRAVTVTGLIPLQISLSASRAALFETPRMFQPGYVARLNGTPTPVLRSTNGLAMIHVPAGQHRVDLAFRGPTSLMIAYWLTLTAWAGLIATAATVALRRIKS